MPSKYLLHRLELVSQQPATSTSTNNRLHSNSTHQTVNRTEPKDGAAPATWMATSLQQNAPRNTENYDCLVDLANEVNTHRTNEAKQLFNETFDQTGHTLTPDEHTSVMLALGHRTECVQGSSPGCDMCQFMSAYTEGAQAEASTCECSVLFRDVSSFQLPHPKCQFCAQEERKKFQVIRTSSRNNNCLWYALQEVIISNLPKFSRLHYSPEQTVDFLKRRVLSDIEEFCMYGATDNTDAAVVQEFAALQNESDRHDWVASHLGSNAAAMEFAFMRKYLDGDNRDKFDTIVEQITQEQINAETQTDEIQLRVSRRLTTRIDDACSTIAELESLQNILINDGEMSEEPCAKAIARTFETRIHIYDVASRLWHVYTPPSGSWKGDAYVELNNLHYSTLRQK